MQNSCYSCTNKSILKIVELHARKCQMTASHSSTQLPCVTDVKSAVERLQTKCVQKKTAHGHIQVINY